MKYKVRCDIAFFYNFPNKLALFTNRSEQGTNVLIDKLKYPYINFDIGNIYHGNVMIFQNNKVKRKFLKGLNMIMNKEKETGCLDMCKRHMLVGTYLGFPPKAIDYFSYEKHRMNGMNPVNIGINYYGLFFASYPETIDEDINWLEDKYGKPFVKNKMINNLTMQLQLQDIAI